MPLNYVLRISLHFSFTFICVYFELFKEKKTQMGIKTRLMRFCSITQQDNRGLTWATLSPVLDCNWLLMRCAVFLICRALLTSSLRRPTWRWLSAHTPGGNSLWRRSLSAQVSSVCVWTNSCPEETPSSLSAPLNNCCMCDEPPCFTVKIGHLYLW